MSAWLSVYCRRSVTDIRRIDLLKALELADPYLAAEAYGIEDEAVVDTALAQLRLEPTSADEFRIFELHYRPAPSRPVVIDRKASPSEVQMLVQEELSESLAAAEGLGAERIRGHLAGVQEIVDFELGFQQLEDMGMVFCVQLARWIAELGEGYVKDQNGIWWEVHAGTWRRLFPAE